MSEREREKQSRWMLGNRKHRRNRGKRQENEEIGIGKYIDKTKN